MKTRRNRKVDIIHFFIELLNVIKLYHWKTKSFPEHKNTDELYSSLNDHVDHFVEVMIGITSKRPSHSIYHINAYNFSSKEELKKYLSKVKKELVHMNSTFKGESDLLNIRDEILGDIHRFEYLLTFH